MPRQDLSHGAFIDLEPGWLSSAEAAELQQALTLHLDWEQRHIVLFGKRILQPRLIAWMGELPYRYSGQTLEPKPWPLTLLETLPRLCHRVRQVSATAFNHVLVNRYRDGNDSMGYHSDNEPELGPDPVVASVSLGRMRRFVLKGRGPADGQPARSLELECGSLLVMGGTCQRHYRHAILREKEAALGGARQSSEQERISLTFRRVLGPPGAFRSTSAGSGTP